jgi:hypothetical protein
MDKCGPWALQNACQQLPTVQKQVNTMDAWHSHNCSKSYYQVQLDTVLCGPGRQTGFAAGATLPITISLLLQ